MQLGDQQLSRLWKSRHARERSQCFDTLRFGTIYRI
jgi:hypothetical protein